MYGITVESGLFTVHEVVGVDIDLNDSGIEISVATKQSGKVLRLRLVGDAAIHFTAVTGQGGIPI